MKKNLSLVGFFIASFLILFSFQNCSNKVNFGVVSFTNNNINALVCDSGASSGTAQMYFPTDPGAATTQPWHQTGCLIQQDYLPTSGVSGIEINDVYESTINILANDAVHGSPTSRTLYVEITTYAAPDSILITYKKADGSTGHILNICDISTSPYGAPAETVSQRPYSDDILQFKVTLPAGVTQITFDFTGATTPTYVGIWNLVDFTTALSQIPAVSAQNSATYINTSDISSQCNGGANCSAGVLRAVAPLAQMNDQPTGSNPNSSTGAVWYDSNYPMTCEPMGNAPVNH